MNIQVIDFHTIPPDTLLLNPVGGTCRNVCRSRKYPQQYAPIERRRAPAPGAGSLRYSKTTYLPFKNVHRYRVPFAYFHDGWSMRLCALVDPAYYLSRSAGTHALRPAGVVARCPRIGLRHWLLYVVHSGIIKYQENNINN